MTRVFKTIFAVVILALSFAAPVTAGPLEDGTAAYQRGDYAAALRLLRPQADRGGARAQDYLGNIYNDAEGVPPNYGEAVKWYRKAADQGLADAQRNLGWMYDYGRGVPLDYAEAARWYRKAADQGDVEAQSYLGGIYYDGKGVPLDYAAAAKWYRKAADQGDVETQAVLGEMYENGRGVPQDNVQAYMWFNVAASISSSDPSSDVYLLWYGSAVRGRDAVATKMSPAQIAEAQKLALEWKPTTQPTK